MPRSLTFDQKRQRIGVIYAKQERFFMRYVAIDARWNHHYTPPSGLQLAKGVQSDQKTGEKLT